MGELPQPPKADHLCVLVHGLWGNPNHLRSLEKALRDKHDESTLHILVAKTNSQNYTYDGIDVGGERVAREVEEELEKLSDSGYNITKLSVVGYSLGGLIARYSIGLLYSRGWFDKLKPINFTAFASPFLGVRTPRKGYHSTFWNAFGGHTLSYSGQQLFLLDTFRDTGRPILSVLADPNSIFIRALCLFQNRSLYANIQNDRSAPYYTTYISSRDPYEDLSAIDLHPIPGYSPTILSPTHPVSLKTNKDKNTLWSYISSARSFLTERLPVYAFFTFVTPLAASIFLLNSGYQTFASSKRMRLHNDASTPLGLGFRSYRIPLMVEGAVESVQARAPQEHLDGTDTDTDTTETVRANGKHTKPQMSGTAAADEDDSVSKEKSPLLAKSNKQADDEFPILALAPEQFEMIRHLDAVGWRKYAVNITKVRHSHAAIIVRMERATFEEGRTVIGHWLEEEFEI